MYDNNKKKIDDHDGLWDFYGIMMFRQLEQERRLKEQEAKENTAKQPADD